jgi:guanyl-specific ribonuclease Sa
VGYREYDLRLHDGSNRGKRRMVVGGGKKFYTADHYGTFAKFAG